MDNYVIVAGSRGFNDEAWLIDTLDSIHRVEPITAIISGTARGADSLGERWAAARNVKCLRMPAKWDRYGKSAGYRRNEDMAKIANRLVAFWDGKSRGTQHMINIARERGIRSTVLTYS